MYASKASANDWSPASFARSASCPSHCCHQVGSGFSCSGSRLPKVNTLRVFRALATLAAHVVAPDEYLNYFFFFKKHTSFLIPVKILNATALTVKRRADCVEYTYGGQVLQVRALRGQVVHLNSLVAKVPGQFRIDMSVQDHRPQRLIFWLFWAPTPVKI